MHPVSEAVQTAPEHVNAPVGVPLNVDKHATFNVPACDEQVAPDENGVPVVAPLQVLASTL